MITNDALPIWNDYLEMNSDFEMVLRPDTPEDIRSAYEAEQKRIRDSEEPIFKL